MSSRKSWVCDAEGRMLSLTKLAPSGKCNVVTDIPIIAKIEVPKSQTHHHLDHHHHTRSSLVTLGNSSYAPAARHRPKKVSSRPESRRIMKISSKTLSLALATTCMSASTAFTTRTPTPTAKARSNSQLNLFEISASLQLFYTTALVAGVGYTQRMAGREDFKKEMAIKIARGEITPQQLVEEIQVLAEEINDSANAALSAQAEVQLLLEETRALQQKLELPSSDMSSLREFTIESLVEEKVPVSGALAQKEEAEVSIRLPTFAIESNAVGVRKSETNSYEHEFNGAMEDVSTDFHFVNGANKEPAIEVISHDYGEEEVDYSLEMDHDDADLIADALLATPPSMRSDESDSLNASDALRLAQEALASASESITVNNEENFRTPVPPSEEPSIDHIREGIEIDASVGELSVATIDIGHKQAKSEHTGPIRSSPLARLLCTELGVDLKDVYPGTGLKGRVVADDVRKYAAAMPV
ncbi:hypothetical protein HJC23_009849 [Cyclotella cryptica]|uniref:Peripheral subunit-binding (PSBD) domain-containing protein n=1 Tax=Cyclotella cryptica TaxID=29204 RepID=A0ABD3NTJ3_9STRA